MAGEMGTLSGIQHVGRRRCLRSAKIRELWRIYNNKLVTLDALEAVKMVYKSIINRPGVAGDVLKTPL